MSTVATKPRRVPPPCWTQDEAQSLILAYRNRRFSLRRTNLKAADWDHVAADFSSSTPAKTAMQCRHKMEKLRKRYRAEKQRSSRCPGRWFSSWGLFQLMDEMESDPDRKSDPGGEFGVRVSIKDRNFVKFERSCSDANVGFDEMYRNSIDQFDSDGDDYINQPRSDYGIDVRGVRDFVSADFRGKSSGIVDRMLNVDCNEGSGYASVSGSRFAKKSSVVGVKRGVDAVEDLASWIMQLGEGFVRMEKMKMEMTMEIEKMRMEMEMKRNEVMIESHQQIVDAFVSALVEMKKKRKGKVESSRA